MSVLANFGRHEWELCGIARIIEKENAESNRLGRCDAGSGSDAVEVGHTVSPESTGEDLHRKNGRSGEPEVAGASIDINLSV